MKSIARWSAILALIALAGLAAWRVVAIGMSDQYARIDPQRALEWNARNPTALLAIARGQLDKNEIAAAEETTRTLLAREPLTGQAFAILSEAASRQGNSKRTRELSLIALRHAPLVLGPRAWLADEKLQQGHYAEALDEIERILRISPRQAEKIFPVLIDYARNRDFAEALADKLRARPTFRDGFLDALLSTAKPEVLKQVLSALQRHRDLDTPTLGRWIDQLTRNGAWGEAYARWTGTIMEDGLDRLANVFNGGFESAPSNTGFDWRIDDSTGVIIERTAVAGVGGPYAVSMLFLGRRVESIPIHHWLLLSAGSYRLDFRAMAQDLRSDRGVQWVIRCLGSDKELAESERFNGSFDWNEHEIAFDVPDRDCQAQDLWIRNAGAAGAGKLIRGTISFDDFVIERTSGKTLKSQSGTSEKPVEAR